MRAILTVIALVGWVLVTVSLCPDAQLEYLLSIPALFLILGGSLSFIFINISLDRLVYSLAIAFSDQKAATAEDCDRAMHVFETGRRSALLMGLLGFVLSMIMTLRSLGTPEILEPYLSLCVSSAFYAILLAETFFHPLKVRCMAKRPVSTESETTAHAQGEAGSLIIALLLALLATLPILVALHQCFVP